MILPITLTIAAAAALLNVWLSFRIGRVRMARRVSIGHGGDTLLETRMRAQANFVEYTPFVLILLGLIELARGSQTWLWLVAIVYILARIAHAFGMERPAPNPLRAGGAVVTMLVLVGLAGFALAIPYLGKAVAPATISPAPDGRG
jgi:uncharacterized membrane protein YecN with MAPEG domain